MIMKHEGNDSAQTTWQQSMQIFNSLFETVQSHRLKIIVLLNVT